jgi:hypothetical protein
LAGAEQLAERLKTMLPPQAQGQDPMVQQLQQQLQQVQQQVGQMKQALDDKTAENKREDFNADTDRIKALADAHAKGLLVSIGADGGISTQYLVPPQPQGMPPQGQPGMPPMGMPQPPMMNTPEQRPGL